MKFHKFWTDARSETPRVIFITEYMTSGSLKQFLKKTRKSNYKTLNEKVILKLITFNLTMLRVFIQISFILFYFMLKTQDLVFYC